MCIAVTLLVMQCETFGKNLDRIQTEIEKQRETIRIKTRIIKALQSNGIEPGLGQADTPNSGPTIKQIPKPEETVNTAVQEPAKDPVLLVIGEPACKYTHLSFVYPFTLGSLTLSEVTFYLFLRCHICPQ